MTRLIRAPSYELDLTHFHELRSILIGLTGGVSTAARAISVDTRTFRKWEDNPPKQWFWNEVIIAYITSALPELSARTGSKRQRKISRLKKRFRAVVNDREDNEDAEYQAMEYRGAVRHLAKVMGKNPQGIFWDRLITSGYSGGYSPRQLRRAAHTLGVKVVTSGFGPDKETHLTWDDDDVEGLVAQPNEVKLHKGKNRRVR